MTDIKLYWTTCGWRCGNAGDEASRPIISHLTGRQIIRAEDVEDAELVAIGSIAHQLSPDFRGTVWGTGIMFEFNTVDLPNAQVVALRGKFSARRWRNASDVPLGDPGLLIEESFHVHGDAALKRYQVGIVPHYIDGDNLNVREWAQRFEDRVTVIDICGSPRTVLRAMAECECILSSSLHGLVFADALGIPNDWIVLSNKVQGGSFKFRDYYSVFDIHDPLPLSFHAKLEPGDTLKKLFDEYDRPNLVQIQKDLVTAIDAWRNP